MFHPPRPVDRPRSARAAPALPINHTVCQSRQVLNCRNTAADRRHPPNPPENGTCTKYGLLLRVHKQEQGAVCLGFWILDLHLDLASAPSRPSPSSPSSPYFPVPVVLPHAKPSYLRSRLLSPIGLSTTDGQASTRKSHAPGPFSLLCMKILRASASGTTRHSAASNDQRLLGPSAPSHSSLPSGCPVRITPSASLTRGYRQSSRPSLPARTAGLSRKHDGEHSHTATPGLFPSLCGVR